MMATKKRSRKVAPSIIELRYDILSKLSEIDRYRLSVAASAWVDAKNCHQAAVDMTKLCGSLLVLTKKLKQR